MGMIPRLEKAKVRDEPIGVRGLKEQAAIGTIVLIYVPSMAAMKEREIIRKTTPARLKLSGLVLSREGPKKFDETDFPTWFDPA